uniref:Tyrosyl-DNA phosphodiesterase 2 n=1 Tax=Neolamprologus brichardi TaxID=32507 RepID=A0A3Q4H8S6_NEOBR
KPLFLSFCFFACLHLYSVILTEPLLLLCDSAADSPAATQKPSEKEDFKLSLITWNVEGINGEKRPERARSLVKYLNLYKPDVVFLQELIPPYVQFLKKRFVSYLMIEGAEKGYFTGMLLKKSRVTFVESEIVPYRTTQMMRNLLVVIVDGQKLCLMTSHFESFKACSKERMNQLHVVKWRFKHAPDDVTVVIRPLESSTQLNSNCSSCEFCYILTTEALV